MNVHRNTASIILNGAYLTIRTILKEYPDIIAVTCHSLIDGVVDNLVNKVMQTIDTC